MRCRGLSARISSPERFWRQRRPRPASLRAFPRARQTEASEGDRTDWRNRSDPARSVAARRGSKDARGVRREAERRELEPRRAGSAAGSDHDGRPSSEDAGVGPARDGPAAETASTLLPFGCDTGGASGRGGSAHQGARAAGARDRASGSERVASAARREPDTAERIG